MIYWLLDFLIGPSNSEKEMVSMSIYSVVLQIRKHFFHIVLVASPAGFLIGLIGCVAPPVGRTYQNNPVLPITYGILIEDQSTESPEYRIATASEWRQVRILRGNRSLNVAPNLYLDRGDEI